MVARYALVGLLMLSGIARADDDANKPWSHGVTAEQKAKAQQLLAEGNDLFVQNKHLDALHKYEEAVAAWDHPSIRFNMVRALIALDRPLDAYDNLKKALAYGKEPLQEHVYEEATNYLKLLEGRIATVEISCQQLGVKVSVDGAEFLTCPGTKEVRTTPGNHAVVGSKDGFLTKNLDTVLLPGGRKPIVVSLVSLQAATVTRTRWPAWKPWVVTGAGAAVLGAGVLLQLTASSTLGSYDDKVRASCPGGMGCPSDPYAAQKSRGLLENKIAIGMLAVGGAALVGGVTLVIMNRPRTFIPKEHPTVTPAIGSGGAGLVLSATF